MDEENRIAVLGDYDSIYGFASLGLSTFPVDNIEDASKLFVHWQPADMESFISQKSLQRRFLK